MFIYKTINTVNNKIYIGKSELNEDVNYLGSGIYLKRAIKKYGKENFIREIIETDIKSSNLLCHREIYYIKKFNSTNINIGYNISKGGDGHPVKHSEKTRKKLSKIKKEEYKNKKNHPMFGKHHKKETKDKLRNINIGKKHTKDAIIKMSNASLGRKHSQKTKEKISKSNKGRKFTEKHKLNISKNHADMSGMNNPMYKKSIYSVWVEKYGEEIAKIKYQNWVKNVGISSKLNWERRKGFT